MKPGTDVEKPPTLLKVEGLSKKLGSEQVLSAVDLLLLQGRKLAIAGATGSGKSSLLKAIAGLLQPDTGSIHFDGQRVLGPDEKLLPGHSGIAYLSQHFELRNHYRVSEILSYANLLNDDQAESIYRICRIHHLLPRWTDELSGGEKQRIALARLLIGSPRLLLLDEPYSNLDMIHKGVLKAAVEDLSTSLGITVVLVSHDPDDVLPWADEMIVLRDGLVVQRGDPRELYWNPVDAYVAGLLGPYSVLDAGQSKSLGLNGATILRPGNIDLLNDEEDGFIAEVRSAKFIGYGYTLDLLCRGVPLIAFTTDDYFATLERISIRISSVTNDGYPTDSSSSVRSSRLGEDGWL